MNQQERKYCAKRIEQVEEEAIKVINERQLTTPDPSNAIQKALKNLPVADLRALIIAKVEKLSAQRLRQDVSVDIKGSHYDYTTCSHVDGKCATITMKFNVVESSGELLPDGSSYTKFYAARTAERKAKQKLVESIKKKAARCRDRAMLGDGSAALDAFDKFLSEIAALEE